MTDQILEELKQLSVADSVSPVLTGAQKAELDHRLSTPDVPLHSWAEIKAGFARGK
jgi:hypothetical protein